MRDAGSYQDNFARDQVDWHMIWHADPTLAVLHQVEDCRVAGLEVHAPVPTRQCAYLHTAHHVQNAQHLRKDVGLVCGPPGSHITSIPIR